MFKAKQVQTLDVDKIMEQILENHDAKLMKCANTSKYMVINVEPTGCLSMWMKSVPDK